MLLNNGIGTISDIDGQYSFGIQSGGVYKLKAFAPVGYIPAFPINGETTITLPYNGASIDFGFKKVTVNTSDQDFTNHIVYPNPVTNKLQIVFNANQALIDIKVFDNTGRTYALSSAEIENGIITMDVSSLPAGIYFLKVGTENFSKFTKFIKID